MKKINYANIKSVIPARVRSAEYPTAPSEDIQRKKQSKSSLTISSDIFSELESEFIATSSKLSYKVPHFMTQTYFNDIVRDANLSKGTVEIVASEAMEFSLKIYFKIRRHRKHDITIKFDKYFYLDENFKKNLQ